MRLDLPFALAGIRVLDLGQLYQGPYASMLLAKAGAEVIKIEPPHGEPLRQNTQPGKTGTYATAVLNANKSSVTLNLKSERGRDLLIALVRSADILVENFSPGTMDELGVGYSVLSQANPRLIYATGTGYGISGPDRDHLAVDLTIQAMAGVMSITGWPDNPPTKAGPTVADFMGGIHLYGAILTALYQRTITNVGQLVEVALQEAIYSSLVTSMQYHVSSGKVPPRTGNRRAALTSNPHNVFPTRDGWVAIHIVTNRHWLNLTQIMGRVDLGEHPLFATQEGRGRNLDAVEAEISAWTRLHDKRQIADLCVGRVPLAPVRGVDEVMADTHMHERGFLSRVDHPDFGVVTLPNSALRLHGATQVAPVPSVALGNDNETVLGGMLGVTAQELLGLRQDGVI